VTCDKPRKRLLMLNIMSSLTLIISISTKLIIRLMYSLVCIRQSILLLADASIVVASDTFIAWIPKTNKFVKATSVLL
jgi:hypothetical protein